MEVIKGKRGPGWLELSHEVGRVTILGAKMGCVIPCYAGNTLLLGLFFFGEIDGLVMDVIDSLLALATQFGTAVITKIHQTIHVHQPIVFPHK